MRLIIYSSRYRGDHADVDATLRHIRDRSKEKNLLDGITGILFYQNGYFLQAIEGDEEKLDDLMKRLHADPRHADIDVLVDTTINSRAFSDWNMDTIRLDKVELFTPEMLKKLTAAFSRNVKITDASLVLILQELLNTPGIESILNV